MDVNLSKRRSSRQFRRSISSPKLKAEKQKREEEDNSLEVHSKSRILNKKDDELDKDNEGSSEYLVSKNVINKKVMVTLFRENLEMFGPLQDKKVCKDSSSLINSAKHTFVPTEKSILSSPPESSETFETIDQIRNEINSFSQSTNSPKNKRKTTTSSTNFGTSTKNKPSEVSKVKSSKSQKNETKNSNLYNDLSVNNTIVQHHDRKEVNTNNILMNNIKTSNMDKKSKVLNNKQSSVEENEIQSSPVLSDSSGFNSQSLSSVLKLNQSMSTSLTDLIQNNTSISITMIEPSGISSPIKNASKTPIKIKDTHIASAVDHHINKYISSPLKESGGTKLNKNKAAVRFEDEVTNSHKEKKLVGISHENEVKSSRKSVTPTRGKNKENSLKTSPLIKVSARSPSKSSPSRSPRKSKKSPEKKAIEKEMKINQKKDSHLKSPAKKERDAPSIKKSKDKGSKSETKEGPQHLKTSSAEGDKKTPTKGTKRSYSPRKKKSEGGQEKKEKQEKKRTSSKESQKEISLQSHNDEAIVKLEKPVKRGKAKQDTSKPKKGPKKKETKEKGKIKKVDNEKKKENIETEKQDLDYESDISINDGNMPVVNGPETVDLMAKSKPVIELPSLPLLDNQHPSPKKHQTQKSRGRKKLGEDGQKPRKKRGRKRIKKEVVEKAIDLEKPWVTEDEEDEEEDELLGGDVQKRKERKLSQRRTGRRFSVTGNWYIASGYLNDIISLLEDFDEIDSWRFRDFAKCWQKKNFSLVYRGRQTFKELLEFTEEIALLTKRFLNPPHSTKRRIGALYALYGLYYKFPLGKLRFFHLRFEYGEYEDLLALIFPFRSNPDNPDPAFIFRKLELEGAILHCASAIEPCYDFHNEERDHVELEYGKEKLAKSSAVLNAVPKVQLQADLNLLQHYHSLKAKVAGQNEPEKALSMITPEFLVGISTNLSNLRQNTLHELGMSGQNTKSEKLIEKTAEDFQDIELPDAETEMELYSVDQNVIDAINQGPAGQRSQKALQNNQIITNVEVKNFMRPPTTEDLCQPLLLSKKGSAKEWKMDREKAQIDIKASNSKPTEELLWENTEGKLLLDVDEEPRNGYSELTDALLPQPLPPKKKRNRKRPATLLFEASCPRVPNKRIKKETHIFVKSLSPFEEKENIFLENNEFSEELPVNESQTQSSATRLLVSELPDVKPKDSSIIVKVRMKAGTLKKLVKLKIKLSLDQFAAIQKNQTRFSNFKNQLKPLIKATQKKEHQNKDWHIEDIFLHEEEKENIKQVPTSTISSNSNNNNNKNKNGNNDESVPSESRKDIVPFKKKYECLKYSDDEEGNEKFDDDDDDDDEFRCKWKTEEEKDGEYCPPEEAEEEVEDPLEYTDDEFDDDYYDDDYSPEPHYFWRKRKHGRKSYYYGDYFESRGPRDSDQLLAVRSKNSVSMVPMRVGNKIKYFPMIQTQSDSPSKPSKEKEMKEKEDELAEDPLAPDPNDEKAIFTWNDFSSDKSPPFKKRRCNNSFSYIFSPKIPLKKDSGEKPILMTFRSSTVIKEAPKVNTNEEENIKNESEESDGDESLDIKKEKTYLEEIAGDWDDEESTSNKVSQRTEKLVTNDPLDVQNVENNMIEGHMVEDFHDNMKDAYIEDTQVYPIDNADIVDATGFYDEDPDDHEFQQNDESVFADNVSVPENDLSNSLIEEAARKVSQILPDISVANDYGSNLYMNNEDNKNSAHIPMENQTVLPGNIIMTCPGNTTLDQQQQLNSLGNINGSLSSVYSVDIPDPSMKQSPLYYKMTAPDGNNIFVPVSSITGSPKDIKILSFDVTDVKPLTSAINSFSNDSGELNVNNLSYSNSQEQISDQERICDRILPSFTSPSSLFNESSEKLYLNNSNNSIYNNSNSEGELILPKQNSSVPLVNSRIAGVNPTGVCQTESKPSCSFLFSNKKSNEIPGHKPSTKKVTLKDSNNPSCSFLFSRKFQKTFKNFPSAKGEAIGKVSSTPPKVKFFMKGMFKSSKKF